MATFNTNRLRFVHCSTVFETRDDVKKFIDKSYVDRPYLFAEPCVYLYGSKEEPKLILAIGTVGNGEKTNDNLYDESGNKVCKYITIDIALVEEEIESLKHRMDIAEEDIRNLKQFVANIIAACGLNEDGTYHVDENDPILKNAESLANADKLLSEYIQCVEKTNTLSSEDTNTVALKVETEECKGTSIKAEVKLGAKIYEGHVINNIIVAEENGIFTSVDIDYDEETSEIILTINGGDAKDGGLVKRVPIPEEIHVIGAKYDKYAEEIIINFNKPTQLLNGEFSDKFAFSVKGLIDEIQVIGEESDTPIVLTKVAVPTGEHGHDDIEDYTHKIGADVRIANTPINILKKTDDGKYLYVDGIAKNIKYGASTVKDTLDEWTLYNKLSGDDDNILKVNTDGLFANVELQYNAATNELTFTSSNKEPITWKLNAVEFIDAITYDATTQTLHIKYKDTDNKIIDVPIALKDLIETWKVDNVNRTITLKKVTDPLTGEVKLSADVNIANIEDNILTVVSAGTDSSHLLYVKGTADNIKFDSEKFVATNVHDALNEVDTQYKAAIKDEAERADDAEKALDMKINAETERAYAAEQQLAEDLADAKVKATKYFLDTQSIDFTTATRDNGSQDISAEVKIDKVSGKNWIELRENGFHVTGELHYDGKTGKLTLTSGNGMVTDVDLPLPVSLINEIRYDALEKKIVIEYQKSDGTLATTFVSVGDLFNEWTVDNSDLGAVTLTKIRATETGGLDVLKAKVEISEAPSNLLVNDNGNLYVSNAATSIVLANGKNLQDAIQELLSKDIELDQSIKDEVFRAKGEEAKLDHKIDDEIERATVAENLIEGKLQDEIARSIARDEDLTADLNATKETLQIEIDRATTAEHLLSDKIDAETERATDAEKDLHQEILDEENRATNAETNLYNKLHQEILDETERATDAEKDLHQEILDETNRATNAEANLYNTLHQEILNETERATDAEKQLQDNIDAEKLRATTKENDLQRQITENKTAIEEEVARSTAKDNEHETAIQTEKERAEAAEEEIRHALSAETEERKVADQTLYSTFHNEVLNEKERAEGIETILNTNINDEITNRTTEIARVDQRITTEISDREHADADLLEKIQTVSGTVDINYTTLDNKIQNEITRSTQTDGRHDTELEALRDALSAETVSRSEEDYELRDYIDSVSGKLDTEIIRSEAQDTEHTNRINTLSGDVQSLYNGLNIAYVDTQTVKLTKTSTPNKLIADVKISSVDGNIINEQTDGIYATVDMSYDIASNKLTLTSSNGRSTTVTLQSVSIVKDIKYLPGTNEIEITYSDGQGIDRIIKFEATNLFKPVVAKNDGHNSTVTVVNSENYEVSVDVNVNDIIDNTDSTVTFSMVDNKIVANVDILEEETNAIKVIDNQLYVDKRISALTNTFMEEKYGNTIDSVIQKFHELVETLGNNNTTITKVEFVDNVLEITYTDNDGTKHVLTCDMNLVITDKIISKHDDDHNVILDISTVQENGENKTLILGNIEYFDCGEY